MHIESLPSLSISILVKKLEGRSSWLLQQKFPSLGKQYWAHHFWVIGFGCWSTGYITDAVVNEYLEYHRKSKGDDHSG